MRQNGNGDKTASKDDAADDDDDNESDKSIAIKRCYNGDNESDLSLAIEAAFPSFIITMPHNNVQSDDAASSTVLAL